MRKYQRETKVIYTAEYKVNKSDTLLNFLLAKCKTSRNNVKGLLSHKQVLVNGSVISQFDYPLGKDDMVRIAKSPVEGETKAKPKVVRPPRITILYEDDDFIAIDKPAGLLAVESDKERENTAYNLLQDYLFQTKRLRIYALHRIDKETSGVLIFAKNPKVYSKLKLEWNEHVTYRGYIAIAYGKFAEKSGTLKNFLMQGSNNLVYVTKNNQERLAITNYEVMKFNGELSLLKINIETGRKNQIRVQMANFGHPLIGDDKYGEAPNPLKRLGLHANILEFRHPFTDEIIRIESPMPNVFRALFN